MQTVYAHTPRRPSGHVAACNPFTPCPPPTPTPTPKPIIGFGGMGGSGYEPHIVCDVDLLCVLVHAVEMSMTVTAPFMKLHVAAANMDVRVSAKMLDVTVKAEEDDE